MSARILPLALALAAAGCAPQTYKTATLEDVVEATITGVRAGVAKGEASNTRAIGLSLCTIEQTWTIASSGTSSNGLTVGISGTPQIPIAISDSYTSAATNSNSNVIKLTWSDPTCAGSGGGSTGNSSGGATTGSHGSNSGSGGGGGGVLPPIVATAAACKANYPGSYARPVSIQSGNRRVNAYECVSNVLSEPVQIDIEPGSAR
jgi:hypothetical protein